MPRARQKWRAFSYLLQCMKTITRSGQAWRGYERALWGEMVPIAQFSRGRQGRDVVKSRRSGALSVRKDRGRSVAGQNSTAQQRALQELWRMVSTTEAKKNRRDRRLGWWLVRLNSQARPIRSPRRRSPPRPASRLLPACDAAAAAARSGRTPWPLFRHHRTRRRCWE